jgi:type IV pilus assembly protein PilX
MHPIILAAINQTKPATGKRAIPQEPIPRPPRPKEQGAVLIIALVMLLILTLLGVSVMESSVVEERMAGNNLDRNIAFQAAEASLRAGEARVASFGNRPEPISGVTPGSVSVLDRVNATGAIEPNWWAGKNQAWWITNGTEYNEAFEGTRGNPRFIIEEYDEVCDGAVDPTIRQCKIIYRVTSIARGGRNAGVLLQSLFARRY